MRLRTLYRSARVMEVVRIEPGSQTGLVWTLRILQTGLVQILLWYGGFEGLFWIETDWNGAVCITETVHWVRNRPGPQLWLLGHCLIPERIKECFLADTDGLRGVTCSLLHSVPASSALPATCMARCPMSVYLWSGKTLMISTRASVSVSVSRSRSDTIIFNSHGAHRFPRYQLFHPGCRWRQRVSNDFWQFPNSSWPCQL